MSSQCQFYNSIPAGDARWALHVARREAPFMKRHRCEELWVLSDDYPFYPSTHELVPDSKDGPKAGFCDRLVFPYGMRVVSSGLRQCTGDDCHTLTGECDHSTLVETHQVKYEGAIDANFFELHENDRRSVLVPYGVGGKQLSSTASKREFTGETQQRRLAHKINSDALKLFIDVLATSEPRAACFRITLYAKRKGWSTTPTIRIRVEVARDHFGTYLPHLFQYKSDLVSALKTLPQPLWEEIIPELGLAQ